MDSPQGTESHVPTLAVVVPWAGDPDLERICSAAKSLVATGAVELIISVDGKPDPSQRMILDRCLASMDPSAPARVVKSSINAGPGSARNLGLAAVLARYVTFTDADDIPDLKAMLRTAEEMHRRNLQVVVGGFEVHRGGKVIRRHAPKSDESLTGELVDFAGVWRFLFLTEWLRDRAHSFEATRYGEDILFLLLVADSDPRYGMWPDVLYQYMDAESGSRLTRAPVSPRDMDIVKRRLWDNATGGRSPEIRAVSAYWIMRVALRQRNLLLLFDSREPSIGAQLRSLGRLLVYSTRVHRQRLRMQRDDMAHSSQSEPQKSKGRVA